MKRVGGLLLLSIVSIPAASAWAAPPSDSVVDRAIESLSKEVELLPLAGPENAAVAGHTETVDELRSVDRDGAKLLDLLRGQGVPISSALEATLGPMPRLDQTTRPPTIQLYEQAIQELRDLQRGTTVGTSVPGRTTVTVSVDPGVSWPLVIGVVAAGAAAGGIVTAKVRRNRRSRSQLAGLVFTDSLTGLANRRRLDADLEVMTAAKVASVIAMMIDVDHFKRFNDDHGHAMGDEVLRRVGQVLTDQVRATDVVYRYGGEEFCVLLAESTISQAAGVAERIRRAVRDIAIDGVAPVTVSIGLAEGSAGPVAQVVERADQALYTAKREGRDRVVVGPA